MIGLDSVQNIRSIQLRAFLFVIRVSGYESLTLESQMFLPPSMVTLSIAATRIHRGLVDHASVRHNGQYDMTLSFFSALNVVYILGY